MMMTCFGGDYAPIIRRNNFIYATLGICLVCRVHPAYQTVTHIKWQKPSVA